MTRYAIPAPSEIHRSLSLGPESRCSRSPNPIADGDCQNNVPSSELEAESPITATANINASHAVTTEGGGPGFAAKAAPPPEANQLGGLYPTSGITVVRLHLVSKFQKETQHFVKV